MLQAGNISIFKSLRSLLLKQPLSQKSDDVKMQSSLETSIEDVAKHLEGCMTKIVAAF
jgi:hypothetical protein